MKGKRVLLFFLFVTTLTVLFGIRQMAFAKEGGAPSGNTGSPGDDEQTCAHTDCHTGTASGRDNLIFTDVPATGYQAGQFYTITVSVTNVGTKRFGFQASPQNLEGDLLGDMDLINTSQTKFVGAGKYITHTSTGTNGLDTKSWTFSWTPEDATGDVTFYVAVNVANDDDEATGDEIYTSSVTVHQDTTVVVGIREDEILFDMTNPVHDQLQMHVEAEINSALTIEVIDVNGRVVKSETFGYSNGYFDMDMSDVEAGMYFVRAQQQNGSLVKKVMKL